MDLMDLNKSSAQILDTISNSVTQAPNLGEWQDKFVNNVTNPIQNIGNNLQKFANKLDVPLPRKKTVTFSLLDESGSLVQHNNPNFAQGYMFTLLINPSSFKVTLPPRTVNQVRTMGGWVLQHWYPEIGTISADGIIGNLLQRYNTDVRDTDKWQAFEKLKAVFLNNGIPYQVGPIKRTDKQFNPTAVCVYDQITYSGYFENFDIDENQDNPWTRNYNFTFKFVDMVDTTDMAARTFQGIGKGIVSSFAHNLTGGAFGQTGQAINSVISPFSQR